MDYEGQVLAEIRFSIMMKIQTKEFQQFVSFLKSTTTFAALTTEIITEIITVKEIYISIVLSLSVYRS